MVDTTMNSCRASSVPDSTSLNNAAPLLLRRIRVSAKILTSSSTTSWTPRRLTFVMWRAETRDEQGLCGCFITQFRRYTFFG